MGGYSSIGLLTIKVLAYFITHSIAILTDALEGIVNVVAGVLGLYSLSIAAKPRDADHPYGHGKVEFISAGIEGGMIFLAGGAILYKGVVSLIRPEAINQLDVGIILVAVAGLANFVVGKICVLQGEKNNSLALVSSGKHLQSDSYSSLAILVGLGLLYLTQQQWIDSLVAIAFSFFILFTGYPIIKRSIAGIMDEADEACFKSWCTCCRPTEKRIG
jgi:cation diffusion facilitator family transporter